MKTAVEIKEGWITSPGDGASPRRDATFTEVYELILHNNTMLRSELNVLMHLIEKKLTGKRR